MTRISSDKGDCAYQITIYPTSEIYPMYQVTCNDEEYFGVWVFPVEDAANSFVEMVLSHADAWEVVE